MRLEQDFHYRLEVLWCHRICIGFGDDLEDAPVHIGRLKILLPEESEGGLGDLACLSRVDPFKKQVFEEFRQAAHLGRDLLEILFLQFDLLCEDSVDQFFSLLHIILVLGFALREIEPRNIRLW